MCPSISGPPALFLATPAQAPGLWLMLGAVILGGAHQVAMTLGFTFPRYVARWYSVPSAANRLLALALLIGFYICGLIGAFLLFGGIAPWHSALQNWYGRESDLLLVHGCPLVALNAAYAQGNSLNSQLVTIGLALCAGAAMLQSMRWRMHGGRAFLPQARRLSYRRAQGQDPVS